jgi:hypothetical protein
MAVALGLVMGGACETRAASFGVPGLVLTNQTLRPDGHAALEVRVPSNGVYTLEISQDLKKWGYGFTVETTNGRIPIVSPEPITTMPRLFLRARVGRGLYADFALHFYAAPGSFGGTLTPVVNFPVSLNGYSADLNVDADGTYPDGTNVFFTGPAGSGVANAPSDQFGVDSEADWAWYQSPTVSSPIVPPPGIWSVHYKSTNLTFELPDAQVASHLTIPLPTVTVGGGVLQRVTWTYRNPTNGALLNGTPPHMVDIEVQCDGSTGPGQWSRIYNSDELAAGVTSHDLTQPINWSTVTVLHLAYNDDLGNHYVISYQH